MKISIWFFLTFGIVGHPFVSAKNEFFRDTRLNNTDSTGNRKDYALLFAFDDYQEYPDLSESYKDAMAIATTLQEIYGFKTEVLKNPTRNEVYDKLQQYSKKAFQDRDQLFLFFSGIGGYDAATNEGYLIPSDGKKNDTYRDSHIALSKLNKQIDALPCKHILVTLDCDYSGAFDSGIKERSSSGVQDSIAPFRRPGEMDEKKRYIYDNLKYTSRIYLTSGGLERVPAISSFVNGIMRSLKEKGGKTGILNSYALYASLMSITPRPRFGTFGKNEPGGTFMFIVNSSPPESRTTSSLKGKIQLQQKGIYSRSGLFKVEDLYTLALEIENISNTVISNTNIKIDLPQNTFPNSDNTFKLKALAPKEKKQFQFGFFISNLYQDDKVIIKLEITNEGSNYLDFVEEFKFNLSTNDCVIPQRSNKDHALFFASDNYINLDTLQNPVAEARLLAEELEMSYGFVAEVVENPTRIHIKEKLEEYIANYQSGKFDSTGQFLVLFSGHGEVVDGAGFYLPTDASSNDLEGSSISYQIWQRRIDKINCKHILVLIDACFSGTFDDKIAMRNDKKKEWKRPGEYCPLLANYYKFDDLYTRKYVTSGGKEKTPDESEFAEKLLLGLRVAKNGRKYVTIGEIYEVYLTSARPLPIPGEFGKDDSGSSFMFFVK